MNQSTIIELIGYFGSLLVVISMLMTSVIKLRIINTIGSVIFAGYAFIIHSYPTAFMNLFLVGINVYNLVKLMQNDKHYQLVETAREDGMLAQFLHFYEADIKKYFPDFALEGEAGEQVYVVYNDATPAGVLIGKKQGECLVVKLDYTTPAYRDCSVGQYLYAHLGAYVAEVIMTSPNKEHATYMEKVGFMKTKDGYVKTLR